MKAIKSIALLLVSLSACSCSIQSQMMADRIARDAQWTLEYSIRNEVNREVRTRVAETAERIRNASSWRCPSCGHSNRHSNYCTHCGGENPYLEWDCECGRRHIVGNYCPDCGRQRNRRKSH